MTNTTCSVNGCTKLFDKRFRKGMCGMHYRRLLRTGTTDAPTFDRNCLKCDQGFVTEDGRKKYCSEGCSGRVSRKSRGRKCSVHGCDGEYGALGMCNKHYQRHKKTQRPCKYPACENGGANQSTGYCGTHHNRLLKHGSPEVTMKGKAHKVRYTSDGLRICKVCGEAKPDSEYHKDRVASDGLRAQCKPCRNGYMESYYQENIDERREASRSWRENNLEYARSYELLRYERDRDKRIELATRHTHIRRARLAEVESDAGLTRLALRKRDGDKCYYCHRVVDFSRAVGRNFHDLHATIEHLQPISRGGSHTFDNCVIACRSCNLTKNASDMDEFVGYTESDDALFELV